MICLVREDRPGSTSRAVNLARKGQGLNFRFARTGKEGELTTRHCATGWDDANRRGLECKWTLVRSCTKVWGITAITIVDSGNLSMALKLKPQL